MEIIKRRYIVDEKNNKVGVQLDLETFNKMEEMIENYALYKLMNENEKEDKMEIREAKEYYKSLDKSA